MRQTDDLPVWYRERGARRQYRRNARAWGIRTPKLAAVWLVAPERIAIPDWARAKAVAGLKAPEGAVWLRRMAAKFLAALDEAAGGRPRITETVYRRCGRCGRGLIGVEAEMRWEEDRRWEAAKASELRFGADKGRNRNQLPCGPDCAERVEALRRPRGRPRRQELGNRE